MATLLKLQIGGIRSFGADERDGQKIDFDKPFNLILGRNGCGKTTIIEALKYACTGTLPPGQGTNFVRDPKLDRQIETIAHVKLKFITCQGKTMHVAKLMASTQKYKKLQFATRDVTTSIEENGQLKQLSGRHTDSEALVCRLLGVAKPILNYVIFCHQEESYWPLDENKKLKERFDEIFDSTKYNKCMEVVRKCRKKVMDEMKVHKEAMTHLKEKVCIVKQKRGELEMYLQRLKDSDHKLMSIIDDRKVCEKERNEWFRKAEEFDGLKTKRDSETTKLESLRDQQNRLKTVITYIFDGTEKELCEEIGNFDNQLMLAENSVKKITKDIEDVNKEKDAIQDLMADLQVQIGKLQAEKNHEQELKKERNQELSNLAQAVNLPALGTEPSEAEVIDVIANVNKYFKSLAGSISALELRHTAEEKELLNTIEKCLEVKTKLDAELRQKEQAITKNEIDMKALEDKIKVVNSHRGRKKHIDDNLRQCYQDLEAAKTAESSEMLSRTVESLRRACQELDERNGDLISEIRSLMKIQDVQNQIKEANKKIEELKTSMNKLHLRNKDFTSKHLSYSSDESLKQDFETLIHKWKRDIDTLRDEVTEKSRKESSLELHRKHVKAQLDKKKNELASNKEALFDLCGKKDLNDVLEALQKQINVEQTDKGVFDASSVMFSTYIQKLGVPNACCPLCSRGFDNNAQIVDLIEDIEKNKKAIPAKVKDKTDILMKLQSKQTKLLALKPIEKSTKELEAREIPQLEKEMADVEENLEIVKQEIPLLEASIQGTQADLHSAEAIRDDIYEIDRCQKECKKQSHLLENMKRNHPSTNGLRTSDEALEEQQRVQDELTTKRQEKDKAEEKQRSYERRINDLNKEINNLKADQLKIDALLLEEEGTKTRLDELTALKSALEAERGEVKKKQPRAHADKIEADKALIDAKKANSKALQLKLEEKREKENCMNRISDLQKSLKSFHKKNIKETLQERNIEVEKYQLELEDIKVKQMGLNVRKDKLNALKVGNESKKKDLQENLALMQVSRSIEEQKVVVDELVREIGDADYLGTKNKCYELDRQFGKLTKEMDELKGGLEMQKENIRSRRKELDEGPLRTADLKYREALVDFTVKSHVEKDLQKYYSAIDFAMQKFHKERMDCVNKIIRELWKLIYKGNDIDHIEIETDESATTGTASSEKRKVYNYRVVQDKKGAKIEMKGRCSAGQKVLACLIIRMALAETFSTNCGILTLDEPTTNLDKENIKSLSEAISRIITDREGRKGFQMIVITHDMHFLKAMSHVDAFEHYWEVSRNNQSKSQIVKKAVIKT